MPCCFSSPSCLSCSMGSGAGAAAGGGGAYWGSGGCSSYSCCCHRLAWRRETRLLTAVAVPATTAVRAKPRSSPGMVLLSSVGGLGRFERREAGLAGQTAAGDHLTAGLPQRDRYRCVPAVLPHEHGVGRPGPQRRGSLL